MSTGNKRLKKGVRMKLVICLFAGFILSLGSLNLKNGSSSTEKYTNINRSPHH